MNTLRLVDVLKLKALPEFRLWLRFSDGFEGIRDLSDLVARPGEMLEPLKEADFFARAFVEMGAPTWPNGFDLDSTNLYMQMEKAGQLSRSAAA